MDYDLNQLLLRLSLAAREDKLMDVWELHKDINTYIAQNYVKKEQNAE